MSVIKPPAVKQTKLCLSIPDMQTWVQQGYWIEYAASRCASRWSFISSPLSRAFQKTLWKRSRPG